MRRILVIFVLLLGVAASATAQPRFTPPHGTLLPAFCGVGDLFVKTSGTVGLYVCTAVNTWSVSPLGTASAPGGSPTQVLVNEGGVVGGSPDLTFNRSTGELAVHGPLNLYIDGIGSNQTVLGFAVDSNTPVAQWAWTDTTLTLNVGNNFPSFYADTSGEVDIGVNAGGGPLYLQGTSVNATAPFTTRTHTPSSATDTGIAGQFAWDADFIYICTATNTWKRVGIATW